MGRLHSGKRTRSRFQSHSRGRSRTSEREKIIRFARKLFERKF
jgi:hypothetical protein